jgi:lipopolysaccharide export LptBFGC system permease protein LptF
MGAKNPPAVLEPAAFINAFDTHILFIHNIDDNRLYDITIFRLQPGGDKPTQTIIAKRGEFSPVPGKDQILLKLIDGTSDEQDAENPDNFYKLNFKTFFMTLDVSKNNEKIDKKPKSMSLDELNSEKTRLERLLSEAKELTRLDTEYYRKITWSFSPLIFILLGFPLAVITNKREKSANVMLAILFAAGYYLLSLGCEALSIENIAPPALILWLPNALGGIVAAILNIKVCFS